MLTLVLAAGCGRPQQSGSPFYATREQREAEEADVTRKQRYEAAEAAYKAGKWDESERIYRELAADDPRAWPPRVRLAAIAAIKHEYGEQERWLREVLALRPDRIETRYALVSSLIRQRRYDEATREFQAAQAYGPGNEAVELRLKGALALRAGRLEQALRFFDELVERYPEHASGWVGLGVVKAIAGDFDGAVTALEKAKGLAPRSAVPRYDLALIHYRMEKWELAITEGKEAVRLDPYYMAARNNLAATLLRLGRKEEARAELQKTVELRPTYSPAYNNLGIVWLSEGNHAAAQEAFEKAVHHAPRVASFHFNLALVYFRVGDYTRAREHFNRVIELDPENKEAPRNLDWLKGREAGTIQGAELPVSSSQYAVDEYNE